MGIQYGWMLGTLLIFYLLNGFLCVLYKNRVREDEWHAKMASNSLELIYCALGVGAIAVAEFWLSWLKYGVLILFGIFSIIGIVQFFAAIALNAAAKTAGETLGIETPYTLASNAIAETANIMIVLVVVIYML